MKLICVFIVSLISINVYSQDTVRLFEIPTEGIHKYFYSFVKEDWDSIYSKVVIPDNDGNPLDFLLQDIYIYKTKGEFLDTVEWIIERDGILLMKGTFNNRGLAEGHFVFYDGCNCIFTCYYSNGLKEGKQLSKCGEREVIVHFSKGEKDGISYTLVDGKLISFTNYREGYYDGYSGEFDYVGKVISDMFYNKGIPVDGDYKRFNPYRGIWYILRCKDGTCIRIVDRLGSVSE